MKSTPESQDKPLDLGAPIRQKPAEVWKPAGPGLERNAKGELRTNRSDKELFGNNPTWPFPWPQVHVCEDD
jgi:hypothetical protein